MNILVKHIIRLKNTVVRHLRMLSLKLQYGSQIKLQKFHFRDNFHVYIEDEGILEIGKDCFFNNGCSITARKKISIGDNCIFGENVKIYDHNHCYQNRNQLIRTQGFKAADIEIGNDCWIASNVVILKGVHIGNHCVIGAGIVVYKDIPSNTLVIAKQNLIEKSI